MATNTDGPSDTAFVDLTFFDRLISSRKPINLLLAALGPIGWSQMFGTTIISLLQAQGKLTDDDAQNVGEIIRSGADSKVKKMKIKMNRENALRIDVALGKLKTSRPFRFTAGMRGDTTYEIDVEYFEEKNT